jgi:hypothetical protein
MKKCFAIAVVFVFSLLFVGNANAQETWVGPVKFQIKATSAEDVGGKTKLVTEVLNFNGNIRFCTADSAEGPVACEPGDPLFKFEGTLSDKGGVVGGLVLDATAAQVVLGSQAKGEKGFLLGGGEWTFTAIDGIDNNNDNGYFSLDSKLAVATAKDGTPVVTLQGGLTGFSQINPTLFRAKFNVGKVMPSPPPVQ